MIIDEKSLGDIKPDPRAHEAYVALLSALSDEEREIVLKAFKEADEIAASVASLSDAIAG